LVNEKVRANYDVQTQLMSPEEAIKSGAMALFGEKYGSQVRVLSMGDFSVELCGGTHAHRTGDVGLFKITAETGIAAGIRRLEAITGEAALQWVEKQQEQLQQITKKVKGNKDNVIDKVDQLTKRNRELEKQLEKLNAKLASNVGGDLASEAKEVDGIKVLATKLENADVKTLRNTLDQLKNKLGTAVIVLGSINDGKVNLLAGVTKDITDKMKAGELVNFVAQQVGGKGGGRPDMATAGGTNPEGLDDALASVFEWVKGQN